MKSSAQLRKVQLTGGSTYVVSLPKNWARSVGLKAGDHVKITPQSGTSLLISPREDIERKEELSKVVIDDSAAETAEDVVRELISCYLVGYDIISLKLAKKATEYRSYIKDVMRRKLVGLELIEESTDYMTARCMLGHTEFPVKEALNRMHSMALAMHNDAITALKEGNIPLANEVEQRDDDVDRLYFFVVRQLKMAMENRVTMEEIGLTNARDCLGFRMIVKSIERIADHASRIAETIPKIELTNIDEIIDPISEISEISNDICRIAMKALHQLNVKKANQSITKIVEVNEMEKNILEQILQTKLNTKTIIGLRLILESIRRIGEYGTDIAEIVINLAKKWA